MEPNQTQPPQQPGLLQRLDRASRCASCPPSAPSASLPVRCWQFVRQRQCLLTQICFIAIMLYILAGCQSRQPAEPEVEPAAPASTQPDTAPVKNFAPDTLLSLLTAEIAGYRNQPLLALEQYSQQAQQTRDPQIVSRAYEISRYLNAHNLSLDNALLWAELEPESAQAQRAAALELFRAKQYQQGSEHLQTGIAIDPDDDYLDLVAFASGQENAASHQQLQQQIAILLQQHPRNHNLLIANAMLLKESKPFDALKQLQRIDNLQASGYNLHIKARLLQQLGQHEESLAAQSALIAQQPRNENAISQRAQMLIELERYEQARADFLELHKLYPQEEEYRLALGYINMDMEAWEEAIVYFEELLNRRSYHDIAMYNLGYCHQQLGDLHQAIEYYQQVGPSRHYMQALEQHATILLDSGDEQGFNRLLQQTRQQQPEYAKQISMVEVSVRLAARHDQQAYSAANTALQHYPDSRNLLYMRAVSAERLNNLTQLEQDLNAILRQNPQDSVAMNALGYTLVDRTERLQEGFALIEQALLLNPQDPPTMDSMGWAYYRTGQPQQALEYLRKAMRAMPDAEVAAHLGEVLWDSGKKRQARKIWQQGLELDARHPVLIDTIKRLDNRKQWQL